MMSKKRIKPILPGAVAAVLVLSSIYLVFLRPQSFSRLTKGRAFNVVLITVDTLRADRIACYGFSGIETPTMDLFASRGVKFERCISQTPLTLPSHTTIMTGTLPLFHSVRDNGGFIVPGALVAMAELFKGRGYETAAFVGAYVLDSKWGLNQGFDTYFDRFDLSKFERISLATVQRPANEVMDEALKWLEAKKSGRFFTWIHLYDPHTPYTPPQPFDKKYPGRPYLGEIAFTDSQIGRLWNFLDSNNLLRNTFVVFTSDHGESLGEHEEGSHGFFVYQGAVHVPLIFVTPFKKLRGLSSGGVVSLSDVLPTVCEMSGLPAPGQVQGRSLVPAFFNPKKNLEQFAYSETFYPRFHFGWSELRSVQNDRYKLIIAPDPELYDLAADPKERNNLAATDVKLLADLKTQAGRFIDEHSRNAFEIDQKTLDEETREKLAALGYIGSFASLKSSGKLANPRDKIGIFNELSRAREMGMEGNAEEAILIIKDIIAKDPEINDAYFSLGNIYFRQGKFKDAVGSFQRALEMKPDDTFTLINIANSYQRLGKPEEAEKFIFDFIQKGFPDPQIFFLMGNIKFGLKKYDEAIPFFEQCLSLNSDSAASHNQLAAIYLLKGDLDKAESHVRQALTVNPAQSNSWYNLAQVFEKRGQIKEAKDAYRKELEVSPKHFKAAYNLSRLYRQTGEDAEEERCLRMTLELNPEFPLAYFYLARLDLKRRRNYEGAIDLVKKGLELKPEPAELPLGYFLLADLYNRLGNNALSRDFARKGQDAARASQDMR